uniref:homeodomain-interacting protein kinase 2-like n=1 Tax=Solea senegalensis TaxID=28829 RepID=UPI001CD8979F|nr:homeodomain-interacting protein kinase 2-like [Solea senegalensis]
MYFSISVDELIPSDSTHYEVQELLGRGTYGIVTKCRKTTTNEIVALKILRSPQCMEAAKKEVAFLKSMRNFNLDNFNILKLNTYFTFKGQLCLEFEKLDMNLKQFIENNHDQTLEMTVIRSIVQQMATALEFLKGIGVVHADLKPKNVMVVDHSQRPVRVKVIDFGLACRHPEKHVGVNLQSRCYRAPEVLLGSPFNEAIDVWSLGCVAAELLLGKVLFQGCDEYDMMRWIVFTVGQPPVRVLDAGRYTAEFFKKNVLRPGTNQWTFASRGDETISADKGNMLSDLQTILQKAPYRVSDKDTFCEICERVSFADLVTKMLTVDAADRITPMQILQHPFITMDHLVDIFGCTPYVQSFIKQRRTFQGLSSDNEKDITVPSTYQSEDSSYITASSRGSDPSEGSSVWLSANEHFSPSDSIISEDKADDRKRRRDTDEDPHHDNT